MTKRKPRRKAPKKKQGPIGWIWWTAGILAVGWLAFDANRHAVMPYARQVASLVGGSERQAAATAPRAERAEQNHTARSSSRPATSGSKTSPAPTRVAALPTPVPAVAIPEKRPAKQAAAEKPRAADRGVTTRSTPLHRQPSAEAPVWVTLEAGRPLRVTGRRGDWRRVETGIFTGWTKAEAMTAERLTAPSGPPRAVFARAEGGSPVPPGAIPNGTR